jgi:predicted Fe-Mo cluster-binding NifX family protein
MLAGCEAMICGGMGGGAAQAVIQLGLKPIVLSGISDADQAVKMYCEGKAEQAQGGYCNCQH